MQILKQESNLLLMMKIKIDKKHRNLQLLSKFLWRLSGLDEKPKLFLILLGSCYFQDTSVNISFVFFLFVSFFHWTLKEITWIDKHVLLHTDHWNHWSHKGQLWIVSKEILTRSLLPKGFWLVHLNAVGFHYRIFARKFFH